MKDKSDYYYFNQYVTISPSSDEKHVNIEQELESYIEQINSNISSGSISNCRGAALLISKAADYMHLNRTSFNTLANLVTPTRGTLSPGGRGFAIRGNNISFGPAEGWKQQFFDGKGGNQAAHAIAFYNFGHNMRGSAEGGFHTALASVAYANEWNDAYNRFPGHAMSSISARVQHAFTSINWADYRVSIEVGYLGREASYSGTDAFNSFFNSLCMYLFLSLTL